MKMIFASYKEIPFTENHIKQLHSALLKYSTKDDRHRGDYKKFANSVEAFGTDRPPLAKSWPPLALTVYCQAPFPKLGK
ncbi:MAG: hypothetical protein A2622_00075 [Bdellovibrionales bacterium RIFCSPHIGHO2_01_FULL_40_29]|nr:MAG: hypothetical protein A2622_00075 [Bdellovibrionales bacterium RIFCSPHIGHO2_01_FULL_40_29]OFZ32524.1 MAG: hypothetical protein A3D17_04675 [Bdellovibrionales bacterium RIFCSPHIGHO2_02_FULL_40_15]